MNDDRSSETGKKRVLGCLVIFLTLMILGGIASLFEDPYRSSETSKSKKKSSRVSAPASHPFFRFPKNFNANYQILEKVDISYGNVSRYQWRIVVPKGLSRSLLETSIRHAVYTCWTQNKPCSISVAAYTDGDDIHGPFTAGSVDFAPFGKWSRAGESSKLSDYKGTVKLADIYFQTTPTIQVGSLITLKECDLSRKEESWTDQDFIVRVPENTIAKILQIIKSPITDSLLMIRYQVEAKVGDETFVGWIHSFDVKS